MKAIFPLLLIFAAATIILILTRAPLIRGVTQNMLVSPSRPAVAFQAAPDFRLTDAARADPAVNIRHSQAHTTARLWYALYTSSRQSAWLTAMFAEIDAPYYWPPTPDTPARGLIRKRDIIRDNHEGTSMTFVLTPDQDPWNTSSDIGIWHGPCLVRRFVFQTFFLRFSIVIEYREPLPECSDIPIEDNLPVLAAFEKRADEAFHLLTGTKESPLPRPPKRLPYPPDSISRSKLAAPLSAVHADASR